MLGPCLFFHNPESINTDQPVSTLGRIDYRIHHLLDQHQSHAPSPTLLGSEAALHVLKTEPMTCG